MSDIPAHVFPSEIELGAWLPQYEVQQQLVLGHDGAVYLGRQPALGRSVQIKVMPEPAQALAAPLLERLRYRAKLVHPSITAIFDFGRLPTGLFYLVEEHVEGVPLEHLIHEGQLKPKTAFPLALQICEALQIVHDLPMPHGALNKETIFVTADGLAKLSCIGMVQTETGELSWLRPFRGSFTGDIRALGYTLHWMFAKAAPEGDGRLSRDLPPAFATVLRRCLEPGSGRQFTRPEDVAEALKDALRDEQDNTDGTARSRVVVGPGSRQPGGIQNELPGPPPPRAVSGSMKPVARRPLQNWIQRMDDFVWKSFRMGMLILLPILCFGGITLMILVYSGRIVIEPPQAPMVEEVKEAETEAEAPEPPAEVLGGLTKVEPPPEPAPPPMPPPAAPAVPAPTPEPPPPDPLVDLRAQYVAAVQTAANQALETVRLDDLPHLQRELLLLQSGGDIPSVDEPNLPVSLKILRQRYREVMEQHAQKAP